MVLGEVDYLPVIDWQQDDDWFFVQESHAILFKDHIQPINPTFWFCVLFYDNVPIL